MAENFTIALLGAGNMGGAMLRGWIDEGISPQRISIIDPKPSDEMKKILAENQIQHIEILHDKLDVDVLILAVKPQVMLDILANIANYIDEKTMLVSVAAGITIAGLSQNFDKNPIVRTMPNTPAQVGEGVSVCVANEKVTTAQSQWVDGLLSSIGMVEWVDDEALIDPVTGLSGSGPAYIFHMVEAMAVAGHQAGLDADLAKKLARQTIIGAAELLKQSELDASILRQNVTSPGGTTEAALKVLMGDEGLSQLMTKAVQAASQRSKELA